MSLVKRGLSIIPRPIVNLVPEETRDRWRTRMLQREQVRRQRRAIRGKESRQNTKSGAITADVDALRMAIERIDTRLDEIMIRLDQLDARMSTELSGDAPSALDDLADLINPIQRLQESLDNLQVPEGTALSRP